jgi:hypothetical protein
VAISENQVLGTSDVYVHSPDQQSHRSSDARPDSHYGAARRDHSLMLSTMKAVSHAQYAKRVNAQQASVRPTIRRFRRCTAWWIALAQTSIHVPTTGEVT